MIARRCAILSLFFFSASAFKPRRRRRRLEQWEWGGEATHGERGWDGMEPSPPRFPQLFLRVLLPNRAPPSGESRRVQSGPVAPAPPPARRAAGGGGGGGSGERGRGERKERAAVATPHLCSMLLPFPPPPMLLQLDWRREGEIFFFPPGASPSSFPFIPVIAALLRASLTLSGTFPWHVVHDESDHFVPRKGGGEGGAFPGGPPSKCT